MHYDAISADRVKILFWDGTGLVLYAKRLERGRFVWPSAREGVVRLSAAQLAMLLEGIDWSRPRRTAPTAPPHGSHRRARRRAAAPGLLSRPDRPGTSGRMTQPAGPAERLAFRHESP